MRFWFLFFLLFFGISLIAKPIDFSIELKTGPYIIFPNSSSTQHKSVAISKLQMFDLWRNPIIQVGIKTGNKFFLKSGYRRIVFGETRIVSEFNNGYYEYKTSIYTIPLFATFFPFNGKHLSKLFFSIGSFNTILFSQKTNNQQLAVDYINEEGIKESRTDVVKSEIPSGYYPMAYGNVGIEWGKKKKLSFSLAVSIIQGFKTIQESTIKYKINGNTFEDKSTFNGSSFGLEFGLTYRFEKNPK